MNKMENSENKAVFNITSNRTMKIFKIYFFSLVSLCFSNSIKNISANNNDDWMSGYIERHSFPNFMNATMESIGGLMKYIDSIFPTPQEIRQAPKQMIVGYPSKLFADKFDKFCSTISQAGGIKPKYIPTADEVNIQLSTPCNTYAFYLNETEILVNNTNFDLKKKVVIMTTGWQSNPNDTKTVRAMAKVYHCRGDVNFLVYDAANFITTLYIWGAYNTVQVGKLLTDFIIDLTKFISMDNIHLIGHSFGAQVMSSAARHFQLKTGKLLPRVTGLDPANMCFNEGQELNGLHRYNAQFVDVIHSNPGVIGNPKSLGDIDYYPNGKAPIAPGCFGSICSHQRAWQYYAESVFLGNEQNFMARECDSLHNLLTGRCNGEEYAMGYAVNKSLKGNFFSAVKIHTPFGMNSSEEREVKLKNCGLCGT